MAHTRYIVVRDQGQWKISFDGARYGPYATQRDAVRAAVDSLRTRRAEWALTAKSCFRINSAPSGLQGKDPYPPNSSDYL